MVSNDTSEKSNQLGHSHILEEPEPEIFHKIHTWKLRGFATFSQPATVFPSGSRFWGGRSKQTLGLGILTFIVW